MTKQVVVMKREPLLALFMCIASGLHAALCMKLLAVSSKCVTNLYQGNPPGSWVVILNVSMKCGAFSLHFVKCGPLVLFVNDLVGWGTGLVMKKRLKQCCSSILV